MGRTGITYVDVSAAANKLQDQGLNPTVEKVRSLLGTGSKSTIVFHLKKWRSTGNHRVPSCHETNYHNELSSQTLFQLLKELFGRLERALELETERQQLQEKITLLQEKLHYSENHRQSLIDERVNIIAALKALANLLKPE